MIIDPIPTVRPIGTVGPICPALNGQENEMERQQKRYF
jgi:hypothetical protein